MLLSASNRTDTHEASSIMPDSQSASSFTSEENAVIPEEGASPDSPDNSEVFTATSDSFGRLAATRQPLKPRIVNEAKVEPSKKLALGEDRWFAFNKRELLSIVDATLLTMSSLEISSKQNVDVMDTRASQDDLDPQNAPQSSEDKLSKPEGKENNNALSDKRDIRASGTSDGERTETPNASTTANQGHVVQEQLTLNFLEASPATANEVSKIVISSDRSSATDVNTTERGLPTQLTKDGCPHPTSQPSAPDYSSLQLSFHRQSEFISAPDEPGKSNKEVRGVPHARQKAGSELSNNTTPCVPNRALSTQGHPRSTPTPPSTHRQLSTTAGRLVFFDGSSSLAQNQLDQGACADRSVQPCGVVMKTTKQSTVNALATVSKSSETMPTDFCELYEDSVSQIKTEACDEHTSESERDEDTNHLTSHYDRLCCGYTDVSSCGNDVNNSLTSRAATSLEESRESRLDTPSVTVITAPVRNKNICDVVRENSPLSDIPPVDDKHGDNRGIDSSTECNSLLSELLTTTDGKNCSTDVKIDKTDTTKSSSAAEGIAQVSRQVTNAAQSDQKNTCASERCGDKEGAPRDTGVGTDADPCQCLGATGGNKIDRAKKPRKRRMKSWTPGSCPKAMNGTKRNAGKAESECWVALNKTMVYELMDQAMNEERDQPMDLNHETRIITNDVAAVERGAAGAGEDDSGGHADTPADGVSSCLTAHTGALASPRLTGTCQVDGETDRRAREGSASICARAEKETTAPHEKVSVLRSGCHLDRRFNMDIRAADNMECLDLSLRTARSGMKSQGEAQTGMINIAGSECVQRASHACLDREHAADVSGETKPVIDDAGPSVDPVKPRSKRHNERENGAMLSKRIKVTSPYEAQLSSSGVDTCKCEVTRSDCDASRVMSPHRTGLQSDMKGPQALDYQTADDMSAAKALCVLFMGGCTPSNFRDSHRPSSVLMTQSHSGCQSADDITSVTSYDNASTQPLTSPLASTCQTAADGVVSVHEQPKVTWCGTHQQATVSNSLSLTKDLSTPHAHQTASSLRDADSSRLRHGYRATSPKHGWVALSKAEMHTIVDNVVTSMFEQVGVSSAETQASSDECASEKEEITDRASRYLDQHTKHDPLSNVDQDCGPEPTDNSQVAKGHFNLARARVRFACVDDLAQGSQTSPKNVSDLNAVLPRCASSDDLELSDEGHPSSSEKPFKWKSTMMNRAKVRSASVEMDGTIDRNSPPALNAKAGLVN